MASEDDFSAPTPDRGDLAHAVARALLSVVPIAGGAAVELFSAVVTAPIQRRRDEWMEKVGAQLSALSRKGVDLEALQENEQFITAVMQASNFAIKTHQEVKKAALRNAIGNLAAGLRLEDAELHMLLLTIDELSELHLQILTCFRAPTPRPGQSMGGLGDVIEYMLPELRGKRDLYDRIWNDLHQRGLVNTQNLHVTMTSNGLATKRTSNFGDQLLDFIAEG